MTNTTSAAGGLPYALGAYLVWGLFPLYLLFVIDVPPLELVSWRAICTLPICLAIVVALGQTRQLGLALTNPRILGYLVVSALLIGINWLVFIFAVQDGHVLAASLGYYINPMVNILFGTLFLKERLSRLQWLAVGLAGVGVAILALGALDTLWISLTLAVSFSSYGLVRKLAPVESLPGLTIETIIWLIPAVGVVAYHAMSPQGMSLGIDTQTDIAILLAGIVTATPLLLFATAARRMDYSLLGFVQFLAPTLNFIFGLAIFNEQLKPAQLGCFLCIWAAIALFSWDLFSRRKPA
ncbi:MAG: EamA family transporter RarD [Novosphingobium sp.]|nr:EamA family transporter RarD [Novosphingobium sp.]